MIVDIYASGTDCIIESKEYTGKALTVADLLAECAPDMKKDLPLAFELDGAPADRHSMLRGHARLAIRLQPCDYGVSFIIMAIIAAAAAVYAAVMMSRMKKKQNANDQNAGSSIYDPNIQANKAKLLSPIPQQFGYMKRFPDYLNERHSFYLNNKKYETLLLSLGIGWFDDSETYIGNIPSKSLAGKSFVKYYDPGEKIKDLIITGANTVAYSRDVENGQFVIKEEVTGLGIDSNNYTYNLAPYKNWYNSPDVQGIQLNAKRSPYAKKEDQTIYKGRGVFYLNPWEAIGFGGARAQMFKSNRPETASGIMDPWLSAQGVLKTQGVKDSLMVIDDAPLLCNAIDSNNGMCPLWTPDEASDNHGWWNDSVLNQYSISMTHYEKLSDTRMRQWTLVWVAGMFTATYSDKDMPAALPSDTVETCDIPWEVCTPLERLTKVELYRNGSGTDIKVTAHGHSSAIVDGSYPVFDVAFTIHTDSEETDYENRYEEIHDYNRKTVLFSAYIYGSLDSFQVPLIIIPYHNHGYKFNDIAITKTASANGIPDGHPGNWTDYVNCSTVLPDPVPHQYPGEHKCNRRVVRYWVDIKGQVIDVYSSLPDSQFDGYYSQEIGFHPQTYPYLWGAFNETDDGHPFKTFYMLSAMDPKFSPPYEGLLTWMQEFKWDDRSDSYHVNPGDFPEMSITFVPAEDGAAYDGYTPYAYRPQPIGKPITHFQVSVNFPGGIYYMKKNGGYGREDVTIRIAYRKIGDEEWTADSHDVWGNNTDEKGYTYEYDVPEGEYEVKVGLQGSEDSQANNQGSWENLAGIIGEKQVYEGMTTVFCCVQSSNIFSGTNNNQISSFCTRQRNNSGTRVEMSTIEDAAIYLVQSSKYFSMPARLDYAAFKDAQAKYWSGITVNGVFDEKSTFWDCLQDVLKIGFAEPVVKGNVISVAVDRSHKDEAYKYVFHADNIIGDVSVSYSYPTATTITEYEVQYTDPNTWKQAVVFVAYVPRDSYSMAGESQDRFFLSESEYRLLKADDTYANYLGSGRKVRGGERSEGRIYESDSAMTESPQTLELWGVTDRDRAILIAVRALRRQVYTSRNFSFSVDLSALNVQYLDYVGLFVPYSTAGVSGVIRDVAKTDSSYAYLNVKTNSGRSSAWYSDAYTQEADGTARRLTAVPQRNAEGYWDQPNPDTWKVTGADSVTADDAGMPIVCGKAIPCLVQSVTPGADKAKIELSEYSEEIYSKVEVYTRKGDIFDFSYYGDSSRIIA